MKEKKPKAKKINQTIASVSYQQNQVTVPLLIECGEHGISIEVEDCPDSMCLFLKYYHGCLNLHVWNDVDRDPQVIALTKNFPQSYMRLAAEAYKEEIEEI